MEGVVTHRKYLFDVQYILEMEGVFQTNAHPYSLCQYSRATQQVAVESLLTDGRRV